MNGIQSKIKKVEDIIKMLNPHVVCLTETKSETIPIIEGYTWTHKKRDGNKKGGGIATAIRNDVQQEEIPIELETTDAEVCWTRIKMGKQDIYVGNYYGKQESAPVDTVQMEYDQLLAHVLKLKTLGEVILMGDFNSKIGIKTDKCEQNTSRNGAMLEDMIKLADLQIMSTSQISNGIWTRVNRHNTSERSVIDYVLGTPQIASQLTKMDIDEMGRIRVSGKTESDHNTIDFEIKIESQTETQTKETRWKISANTDWTAFNEYVVNKMTNGPLEYERLEQVIVEALEKIIGTKTIKKNQNNQTRYPGHIKAARKKMLKEKKRLKELNHQIHNGDPWKEDEREKQYAKYKKRQAELLISIQKHQEDETKKIVSQIVKGGGIQSDLFWRQLRNTKRGNSAQYDIKDQEGKKINDPEKAREYVAGYFEELYKPWETEEGDPKHQEMKKTNHEVEKSKCNAINISMKEMKCARKKIKNNKALGPDGIPNEVITKANQQLLEIYRHIINDIITMKQQIPEQWKKGNIITIYKGKGIKGQLVNERGITLSSNMGKYAERIVANRILKQINISDNQAGGRKDRSTTDHITTIKNLMERNKRKKKPTYMCFLDVTKAYDKAWLEAIMYALSKSGIGISEWQITKKLSDKLKAQVQTKYGNTREFTIEDSIRQGGVLSVIQYANLMDEIAKNINSKDIGCSQNDNNAKIGILLWMDDVVLISDNENDLQTMLNITDEIAKHNKIKFGKEKSKIITTRKTQTAFKLGDLTLEHAENYRYLGYTINPKNNNKCHIKTARGKAEMAYQTILKIMGNKNFRELEMKTAWKLLKCTVVPILTYAGESMNLTKSEETDLNRILDNILKRLLILPQSTPREPIYLELGMMDITTTINKNKLMAYNRICRKPNTITRANIEVENKTPWREDIDKLREKYGLHQVNLETLTKNEAKKTIMEKVWNSFRNELITKCVEKSKCRFYLTCTNNIGQIKPNKWKYINQLTRREASMIFKSKTRMLDVKTNFKGKYKDTKCRHCEHLIEDQKHILEDCTRTTNNNRCQVTSEEIKMSTGILLKRTATKLMHILDIHLTNN